MQHVHYHAFASLLPRVPEGLTVSSRRNFLKAGLAGLAGLSLPALLRHRDAADLAATIYRHMDVPLDAEYLDPTGRPVPIVYNGKPVEELF
jgi:hypothetical protein